MSKYENGSNSEAPHGQSEADSGAPSFAPVRPTGDDTIPVAPLRFPRRHSLAKARRRSLNRVGTRTDVSAATPLGTLAQRLVYARLLRGLTQDAVAERAVIQPKSGDQKGIPRPLSRNAYCMYETGGVEPSLTLIEHFANTLATTPAWLAFGAGPAPRKRPSRRRPCTCRHGNSVSGAQPTKVNFN